MPPAGRRPHVPTPAFVMSGGGDAVTTDTRIDPATIEQVVAVDDMLRLVAAVAAERHRDPMKALADRLLDRRLAVRG